MDVRVRVGLRLERGPRDEREDEERVFFEDGEVAHLGWVATAKPSTDAFVQEHGHILADIEHLLLQDQVRVRGAHIEVATTLRLEGHALRSFERRVGRGRAGRAVAGGANMVWKQAHEVVDIFERPDTRRAFARAIREPSRITAHHQRALLFLVLLSSIWVWLVGLVATALSVPSWSVPWNLVFSLYFASLGTNLFLPIPVEPLALASLGTVGLGLTVVAAAAGKAVGAWIIYALGPTLRAGMARLEERSALTRRVMAAAERFARRFGYVALGAMLAVPFSPFDIIPVYLFSTMGLRLRPFLLAVFLGFTVRLGSVLLLGQALGLR
jgi:membrane protein DedA with SNARE-associated domain